MTTEAILQLEALNATSIHFVLEGNFWHVNERSAFLTCRHLKELKIIKKYVKLAGRDIVYGGFPKDRLSDLLEKAKVLGASVAEKSEKRCSLVGMPETPGFEFWRESWAVKEKKDPRLGDNLPVYKLIYDLLFVIFEQVRHFPRDFQYTLGERIKNLLTELTEMVYHANTSEDAQSKLHYLKNLCAKTETLRLLLRICYDLRLYNMEVFIRLNDKLEEISKQLNGWRKHAQSVAVEPALSPMMEMA